jgi:thioredoxin
MKNMTKKEFLEKVFDYSTKNKWTFQSELPIVIDFYDEACPPCKAIEPILENASKKYSKRVDFYKVDIKKEEELAKELGINYVPTLVLCPTNDKPAVMQGVPDKEKLGEAIDKELLGYKQTNA